MRFKRSTSGSSGGGNGAGSSSVSDLTCAGLEIAAMTAPTAP
jgi:hypothetical protein